MLGVFAVDYRLNLKQYFSNLCWGNTIWQVLLELVTVIKEIVLIENLDLIED